MQFAISFSVLTLFLCCSPVLLTEQSEVEGRLKLLEDSYRQDEETLRESRSVLEKIREPLGLEDVGDPLSSNDAVVFQAYLSTTYDVMSPYQIIQFNNIVTNIGNAYDANFGRFKAPRAGLYEFVLTATAYSSYMVNLEMVRNGNMLCRAHAGSPNYETGICVSMVRLNVSDDVWVRHYNGQGRYIYNNYHPTFAGHLIKAD